MMTLEEIRRALRGRNLLAVSRETNVAYNTVRTIASGDQINPSYRTVKMLTEYLQRG